MISLFIMFVIGCGDAEEKKTSMNEDCRKQCEGLNPKGKDYTGKKKERYEKEYKECQEDCDKKYKQ